MGASRASGYRDWSGGGVCGGQPGVKASRSLNGSKPKTWDLRRPTRPTLY